MDDRVGAGRAELARRRVVGLVAAAGVLSVLALTMMGVGGSSAGIAPGPAERVLVVAIPGLRWQDLEAVDTPAIDAWLGASALLSVRAEGLETDLVEGYLTLNSGNTLAPSWDGAPSAGPYELDEDGCAAEMADAARRGLDRATGAEVGALGEALRRAGIERSVFGRPEAVAGLMDARGCVERYGTLDEVALGTGVTLIELDGLDTARFAVDRVAALQVLDRRLGALEVPPGTLVVLAATSATTGAAEVTVVGVAQSAPGERDPGLLRSATTRRDGYLRSTDLAPTILTALGLEVPSSMNGTPAQVVDGQRSVDARTAVHADLAERVAFRDRAIMPVSVLVVAATVLGAAAAVRGAARWSAVLAPMAVSLVVLSFLSGMVAYHHLALWVYVLLLVLAAFALAVVARLGERTGGPTATGLTCAVLWAVLVVDVVTGGSLQINTPLGYSPTVAGRFQGIGNLAFGLLVTSSLVVAVGPARWTTRPWGARARRWWVVWVAVVAVLVTGLPRFGSDVGGTLASIPAFVVAASIVVGRRVPRRRIAFALLASVGAVTLLGLLDRARPASERTHLGRFVERLLDGEAGTILERKLRANLSLFGASIWPTVLVLALVLVGVWLWRRRSDVAELLGPRPAERAFLGGLVTAAVLGVLLNDSGVAVPAVMLTVAVPWLADVLGRHGGQEVR